MSKKGTILSLSKTVITCYLNLQSATEGRKQQDYRKRRGGL